jgi:putative two-component system response regulator
MTHGSNNKLVLIVDDTPTNVGVISGVLKGAYRTKVATNGEKARFRRGETRPHPARRDDAGHGRL